jgi:hypothetical protein
MLLKSTAVATALLSFVLAGCTQSTTEPSDDPGHTAEAQVTPGYPHISVTHDPGCQSGDASCSNYWLNGTLFTPGALVHVLVTGPGGAIIHSQTITASMPTNSKGTVVPGGIVSLGWQMCGGYGVSVGAQDLSTGKWATGEGLSQNLPVCGGPG